MRLKALLAIFLSIGLALILNQKIGDVPPLGKFLNPFTGFWKNAESLTSKEHQSFTVKKIKNSVEVFYDDQHIPHITAEDDYDLYFAQGYITAKDRLWQMDFQTRYASGRLAEVVGAKAIPLDRYQRRMGMMFGAKNMLAESMKDPISRLILEAYADGVNAYIASLSPADYPLEFKLMDYAPEPWQPINSALLLKLMSATLAGSTDELYMTNVLKTHGKEVADNLFPNYPVREDPVIPRGTPWSFTPVTGAKATADQLDTRQQKVSSSSMSLIDQNTLLTGDKEEGLGSNNWAISSARSSTGYPMLANDPHLSLTLPSIWYQIQLQPPHTNSCGVSIPGAPCVIIGFNERIAWGVTNVGSDVLDWYQITFKDEKRDFYLVDDQWKKTVKKIEKINVRSGTAVFDTVYYTHHGPISVDAEPLDNENNLTSKIPRGAALKWVAHLPSNDLRTFYELNRAKNYDDYRKALLFFTAPAQNFVFADNQNNIAITPNGYFPLKSPEHGKFILDGKYSENDWSDRIPAEQNPSVKNPPRGFVSSANQSPVDESYPYYLNWEFAPYDRGHRINERLTKLEHATVDSLRLLQLDNRSVLADEILDTLISAIQSAVSLTGADREVLTLLGDWNHCYEAKSIAATIFERWYQKIESELWGKWFDKKTAKMRYPNRDRTVALLLDEPNSVWYGAQKSDDIDARATLLTKALREAIQELKEKHGTFGKNWEWGTVNKRQVLHLANIDGLGSAKFPVNGAGRTVNAIREKSGPSWRMIVALGERPKAYGILPGGSSGNPGSRYYDNQLKDWIQGGLKELLFLTDEEGDANDRIVSKITLLN
ncbi:penicillin acylase family protein [Olivibacter sp. XZL3]|uniref:penicillin acylase family protein n=1 Tax=Olivibacter sp. XZL3 TaxID=1735116 RepID=UPI00106662D0|nr:penicillin acylase family protein [Olivibacter sp. XZL3]